MLVPILLVTAIVAVIAVPAFQRIVELKNVSPLAWLVMLLAIASPIYVATTVLNPGDPIQTAEVAAQKDVVELTVPSGYSLMVTGILSDDKDATKTSYAMRVAGEKWAETITGSVSRSSSKELDVDAVGGDAITESGKRRSAGGGQVQHRFDLSHSGDVTVTVTNYQGNVAEELILEVVKGPPPLSVLWLIAGLVAVLGLYLEIQHGLDKFAGDMAALACYGALMPQGAISPLNNIQGLAFMGLGGLLLGQGVITGIAWVAKKYIASKEAAESEPEPEPPVSNRRRRR